jgi:predicted PolB exonuclease-like 3'-5' exonuclease
MKYLVFDIETRIDKGLVRAIYLPGVSTDEEAYNRVRQQFAAEQRSDFFPVSFHLPISIVLGAVDDDLRLTSLETLGEPTCRETELARIFWDRVENLDGTLVSFNGRAFDLPVLELQALRHGISAPRYFNERYGQRYRYSDRHYDLYDFLTNAGMYRVRGGLDLLTKMLGLPGKTDVDGASVQVLWESGNLDAIHKYCRSDVIQTYLLFLRVERMRGRISADQLERLWDASAPFRAELGK